MQLRGDNISWETSFKYLGVNFVTGTKLSVDTDSVKRKFYVSCNCIMGTATCLNDIIKLNLMESYCSPMLSYATAAVDLTKTQVDDLNAGWNSVYRRIFGFNKWESVTSFILGLGRLNFKYERLYLCLKFVKSGLCSENSILALSVKRHFLSENFRLLCHSLNIDVSQFDDLRKMSHFRLKSIVTESFARSVQ
jgi:hypothetical protein